MFTLTAMRHLVSTEPGPSGDPRPAGDVTAPRKTYLTASSVVTRQTQRALRSGVASSGWSSSG